MALRIIRVALVFVVPALLVGCHTTVPQPDGPAQDPLPEQFEIAFGEGGGFTGRWQGYVITADGTVRSWSGLRPEQNTEQIGTLSAGQLSAFWKQVEEAHFFDIDREEAGNMTAYLEIETPHRQNRVSWIPLHSGLEPATDPIEKLYVFAREMAREAGNPGDPGQ